MFGPFIEGGISGRVFLIFHFKAVLSPSLRTSILFLPLLDAGFFNNFADFERSNNRNTSKPLSMLLIDVSVEKESKTRCFDTIYTISNQIFVLKDIAHFKKKLSVFLVFSVF